MKSIDFYGGAFPTGNAMCTSTGAGGVELVTTTPIGRCLPPGPLQPFSPSAKAIKVTYVLGDLVSKTPSVITSASPSFSPLQSPNKQIHSPIANPSVISTPPTVLLTLATLPTSIFTLSPIKHSHLPSTITAAPSVTSTSPTATPSFAPSSSLVSVTPTYSQYAYLAFYQNTFGSKLTCSGDPVSYLYYSSGSCTPNSATKTSTLLRITKGSYSLYYLNKWINFC